jgi:hypothetical protein
VQIRETSHGHHLACDEIDGEEAVVHQKATCATQTVLSLVEVPCTSQATRAGARKSSMYQVVPFIELYDEDFDNRATASLLPLKPKRLLTAAATPDHPCDAHAAVRAPKISGANSEMLSTAFLSRTLSCKVEDSVSTRKKGTPIVWQVFDGHHAEHLLAVR